MLAVSKLTITIKQHMGGTLAEALIPGKYSYSCIKMRSGIGGMYVLSTGGKSHTGDVVFFGDAQNFPTLWAHEMAHSLDIFIGGKDIAFSSKSTPTIKSSRLITGSTNWTDAYDRDIAISDDYANNSK
jgi:hypothetical protein